MKLSTAKTFSLGVQHLLAMYAAAVMVPLIVGGAIGLEGQELTYLVSIDILMCGVATLLQVFANKFFGIGLPVVLGCTFTAVAPMIAIGSEYGITSVYGAIIVAGLFLFIFSGVFGKLIKFFPPVVTGSVVTIIGITLVPVAINDMAGGQGSSDFGSFENLFLSFTVLFIIIGIYRFSTGFVRAIAILLGLVIGTVIAVFMGKVDFTAVQDASWFHMVQPFYFGAPTFELMPIITMILVIIVGVVEATGVYFAVSEICDRELDNADFAKGYRAESLAIMLGGIFNSFPYTTYSQNVGLIQLSGVKSRSVIITCGGMLVVLGFIPKIAALTTIIPSSVMGGAMLAMFGMVMAYGIKMLSIVDFTKQENLFIVACSVGLGLGVTVVPEVFAQFPTEIQILMSNGIVLGGLVAVVLNIFFNILQVKETSKVEISPKMSKITIN